MAVVAVNRSRVEVKKKHLYIGIGVALLGTGIGYVVYLKKRKLDPSDFDSPDAPGSGHLMDPEFMKKLRKVKKKAGLPFFIINSGYRTKKHNKKVGGVSNSAHTTGHAADIKAPARWMQKRIVHAAKEVGFTRMGIGKTFVHLDNDDSKKQYVAWGYPGGAKPPFNPFG